MFQKTLTFCMVASLLCLGCEEKKQVIDVDSLPEGNGTGTAGTGDFDYHEVVDSSSCPDEIGGHPIPGEGDTLLTTIAVEHEDGYLRVHVARGGGEGYYLDGGIDRDDTFRIGSTYYSVPGSTDVIFINLMDGKYVDGMDGMEGRSKIRVLSNLTPGDSSDRIECELRVDFEATRI